MSKKHVFFTSSKEKQARVFEEEYYFTLEYFVKGTQVFENRLIKDIRDIKTQRNHIIQMAKDYIESMSSPIPK